MIRKFLLGLILLVVVGCNFAPRYEGTAMDIPETWRFDADEASTTANLRWWRQLQDPVLNALIEEALYYNRDLRAAAARVLQFYAQYKIVRSQLFPEIDGNASGYRQELSALSTFIPPGTKRINNLFTTLLNLNYEVDVWGQFRNLTEASYDLLLAEVNARRTVVLTLVSSLATAYIQLRQYDAQLLISQQTLASRKESYDLQVTRFEGGVVSEMEVAQAEAEMEDAKVQLIQYELSVLQQEDLISLLVGQAPRDIERGLALDGFPVAVSVPSGLPSNLLDQRPDIVEAEDQLMAANANIGVAISEYFPQFTLTGFFGNQSPQLKNLFSGPAQEWQYGLAIFQPVFTAGRLTAQVEEADAEYIVALNVYEQTILKALKEVSDALIGHQKSLELVKVEAKRVNVLKVYLHLAQLRYDNGQTDYLTVLDAERTLFNAQLDYAGSQGNCLYTLIELYRSLGGGWVIDADPYENELPCCDWVGF